MYVRLHTQLNTSKGVHISTVDVDLLTPPKNRATDPIKAIFTL